MTYDSGLPNVTGIEELDPPNLRGGGNNMIPLRTRVVEIANAGILDDPITLELESDIPVAFLKDPLAIIDHDKVPVKLSTAIKETYGDDFFYGRDWDMRTLKRLSQSICTPRENVVNTIAQICGPKCQYKDICPHDIVGIAPVGERCPQEKGLIKNLYNEYMTAVSDRLNTDIKNLSDDIITHNLVMGLVEADITSMRLDGSLAKDGFISDVPSVVNEQTGEVFNKEEEAIAVRIKERVYKRRDQIYRQLLATPEMQEKFKRKETTDALAKTADIMDRFDNILTKLEGKTDTPIIDTEVVPDNVKN